MDIGTAKPTLEERQGVPHYLIDIKNPDEEWTVSDFVRESTNAQILIKNKGHASIIVGGTGLYLWSLLEGFAFPIGPADKELRNRLEKEEAETLYSRLSAVDLQAAQKIHPNDKKRIVRALEVFELTGKQISELQKNRRAARENSQSAFCLIGLDLPRKELYERINQRVDKMIANGLIEEVRRLLAKGYSKSFNSMQALGYKEVVDYLEGRWTKEGMITELKKRTRNFARRQLTWFRRFKDIHWFDPNDLSTRDLLKVMV
jgi:tRNA dimethylallyltransferase